MTSPKLWVPDEIVPESKPDTEVRDLRASLRLLRQGKIIGYVDAMMFYRPRSKFTPETPELLAEMRARYQKIAEAKYPELSR